MPNILDSIQVSGSSYDIKDKNAPSVSAVTQQEYDNLPSSAKTSNTFFVITDAQAGDLTQYWTSAQTQSAITQATSGKVDSNVYTAYTASTDTAIQGKQDTLVSGTNIKTINNESLLGSGNITIQGGGGGSYTAGTNISIADNIINCTLPISAGTNSSDKGIIIGDSECSATGKYGVAIGHNSDANGDYSFCDGSNSNANGSKSFAWGDNCDANGDRSWAVGYNAKTASNKTDQFLHGRNISSSNSLETVFGTYNNTSISSSTFGNSGNTLFAIGNGYDFSSTHNHHNAIEIRQNGDIYIPNTNDTSITGDLAYSLYPMIKLQDHLGGGNVPESRLNLLYGYGTSGGTDVFSWSTGSTSQIINDYVAFSKINNTSIMSGKNASPTNFSLVETSAITTAITSSSTDAQVPSAKAVYDKLGGLSLVKLSQSEYDNLSTYDSNTLYVIVN